MTDTRKADPMIRKKLSELTPDPHNANKGTDRGRKLLQGSIRDLGAGRSILLDKHDTIIAGNKTAEAANAAGITRVRIIETDGTEIIAVRRTDLDLATDAVAKKLAIADNRVAELSLEWDPAAMLALSDEIDLGEMFNPKELAGLLASVRPQSSATDDAPDVPKKATTQLGDLYILGDHRLLCGDSTSKADVERAMGGAVADMVWTDPPYNVAYVGKTADALTIENDLQSLPEFTAFLRKVLDRAFDSLKPGGPIYVSLPDIYAHVFGAAFIDSGLLLKQWLIWIKDQFVMGRKDYHTQHEPMLYGWKPGGAHHWYSDRKQTTLLQFDRPKRSTEHPTMKPVALVQYCVENSSKKGETVLDQFGGSGTTMMACEACGRKAVLVELDPKYCDVIVTRWEQATSRKATLIRG